MSNKSKAALEIVFWALVFLSFLIGVYNLGVYFIIGCAILFSLYIVVYLIYNERVRYLDYIDEVNRAKKERS
jgi:high-affinity Fe2+/Pb2+ permease